MSGTARAMAGDHYRNQITGTLFKVVGVPGDVVRLKNLESKTASEVQVPFDVFVAFYVPVQP